MSELALTRPTRTLADAESAAAFLSDLYGINDLRRVGEHWETTPEPNSWDIQPDLMILSDEDVIGWAAHSGWHR